MRSSYLGHASDGTLTFGQLVPWKPRVSSHLEVIKPLVAHVRLSRTDDLSIDGGNAYEMASPLVQTVNVRLF